MSEEAPRGASVESNDCGKPEDGAFYSCIHSTCENVARDILTWLECPLVPNLSNLGTQNAAVIILLQWGSGRTCDAISAVHEMYFNYRDTSQIVIIALTIHDAKDHAKKYCTDGISTGGNITYLEIHQRADGYIHDCKGNRSCKEFVQSKLKPVLHEKARYGTHSREPAGNSWRPFCSNQ